MDIERSYGMILFDDTYTHVVLVQHVDGHWGFPKGHPNEGEDSHMAAQREVCEETGICSVTINAHDPLYEEYIHPVTNNQKIVTYWIATTPMRSDLEVPDTMRHEIAHAVWLSLSDARERLTHAGAQAVLVKAQGIVNTSKK